MTLFEFFLTLSRLSLFSKEHEEWHDVARAWVSTGQLTNKSTALICLERIGVGCCHAASEDSEAAAARAVASESLAFMLSRFLRVLLSGSQLDG